MGIGVGRVAPKQKVGSAMFDDNSATLIEECGGRAYGVKGLSKTLLNLGCDFINVYSILDVDEVNKLMCDTDSSSVLEALAKAGKEILKNDGVK